MPMALDYGRFDRIADDSDDEAERDAQPERKQKLLAQHDAMFLLVGWLSKAAPKLSDVDTTRLVKFVATTDKVVCENSVKRHAAVAQFLRVEASTTKPDKQALIALCFFTQESH